ncbi:hypothetical protein AB833_01215 [Chromatiales bacterium (ex Bugula neritina AB1)]|nr:hypothetical protein AB833_01215 [Chromatiales bacterium (ex Bugula neritina AB1)]
MLYRKNAPLIACTNPVDTCVNEHIALRFISTTKIYLLVTTLSDISHKHHNYKRRKNHCSQKLMLPDKSHGQHLENWISKLMISSTADRNR